MGESEKDNKDQKSSLNRPMITCTDIGDGKRLCITISLQECLKAIKPPPQNTPHPPQNTPSTKPKCSSSCSAYSKPGSETGVTNATGGGNQVETGGVSKAGSCAASGIGGGNQTAGSGPGGGGGSSCAQSGIEGGSQTAGSGHGGGGKHSRCAQSDIGGGSQTAGSGPGGGGKHSSCPQSGIGGGSQTAGSGPGGGGSSCAQSGIGGGSQTAGSGHGGGNQTAGSGPGGGSTGVSCATSGVTGGGSQSPSCGTGFTGRVHQGTGCGIGSHDSGNQHSTYGTTGTRVGSHYASCVAGNTGRENQGMVNGGSGSGVGNQHFSCGTAENRVESHHANCGTGGSGGVHQSASCGIGGPNVGNQHFNCGTPGTTVGSPYTSCATQNLERHRGEGHGACGMEGGNKAFSGGQGCIGGGNTSSGGSGCTGGGNVFSGGPGCTGEGNQGFNRGQGCTGGGNQGFNRGPRCSEGRNQGFNRGPMCSDGRNQGYVGGQGSTVGANQGYSCGPGGTVGGSQGFSSESGGMQKNPVICGMSGAGGGNQGSSVGTCINQVCCDSGGTGIGMPDYSCPPHKDESKNEGCKKVWTPSRGPGFCKKKTEVPQKPTEGEIIKKGYGIGHCGTYVGTTSDGCCTGGVAASGSEGGSKGHSQTLTSTNPHSSTEPLNKPYIVSSIQPTEGQTMPVSQNQLNTPLQPNNISKPILSEQNLVNAYSESHLDEKQEVSSPKNKLGSSSDPIVNYSSDQYQATYPQQATNIIKENDTFKNSELNETPSMIEQGLSKLLHLVRSYHKPMREACEEPDIERDHIPGCPFFEEK